MLFLPSKIHQDYQNEHTSQWAEVIFDERYVYVYILLVIFRNLIIIPIYTSSFDFSKLINRYNVAID